MKYKKQIHSELKQIARKVPYNKVLIRCANIFQVLSFHLTKIPREVIHRHITVEGYKGLKYNKGKRKASLFDLCSWRCFQL